MFSQACVIPSVHRKGVCLEVGRGGGVCIQGGSASGEVCLVGTGSCGVCLGGDGLPRRELTIVLADPREGPKNACPPLGPILSFLPFEV